jgi:Cd2+/Zn2+-exporting ATPase
MKTVLSDSSEQPEWAELLAQFLADQKKVRALKVDQEHHKISVATIGDVDPEILQEKLNQVLRHLDQRMLEDPAQKFSTTKINNTLNIRTLEGSSIIVEKKTCPTAPNLWRWKDFTWPEPEEIEKQSLEEWQLLSIQAGICGLALLAGLLFDYLRLNPSLSVLMYFISIVAGGWDAAIDAAQKLREKVLDIHFLMLAVACGAMAIGAWTEGALLLFLFSFSGALEHYALHRTYKEISALTKAVPKMAWIVLPDGSTEQRAVTRLKVGDRIQVKPDEIFPVDGAILTGQTAADESTLTGESLPIQKNIGAQVFSGTLNLWGVVTLEVEKLAAQSALQKIITLIQEAQHLKAPSQRFTDRFGTGYTWFVLAITAIMFFVWWLLFGLPAFTNTAEQASAFYRSMTLLVVMSPCALALSIPSAILAAIAWGARHGILFRGGAAVEKLAQINVVAMDKTGTLTEGEMKVSLVESFPAGREQEVLTVAVALEANSNHPIARAIVAYAKSKGLTSFVQPEDFQSLTAQGLRGKVDGQVSYIGKRELLDTPGFSDWIQKIPDSPLGFSEVWVINNNLVGRILLHDRIREGSRELLKQLHDHGIRSIMLTGDRLAAAQEIAKDLGVTEVRAGLKPEEKVAIISELAASGKKVAMIGDGVNDAPSLAAAYVSVAMGARGSDAALEQSDIILMKDKIEKFLVARQLSVKASYIIKQNIVISLGAIALMGLLTLVSSIPLSAGVMVHEGSTVVVCLNSLRLLFMKDFSIDQSEAAQPEKSLK